VAFESSDTVAAPNRAQRRRMQTRVKIIEAGREVFAQRGVDAATIEEITETADVGRGSFYNFFATKEHLVEAIVSELIENLLTLEAAASVEYEDPLTALAVAIRSALQMITSDEVLAWFVVRTQTIAGRVAERFIAMTRPLIVRGLERGQLSVDDADVAVVVLGGGVLAGVEMLVIQRIQHDAIDQLVEQLLIGLGARPVDRRRVISAPLPALPLAD
jgi:AcrR family transcriptional regulator